MGDRPVMVAALTELYREQNLLQEVLRMKSNPCELQGTGTPLELARGFEHHECARLLEEAFAADLKHRASADSKHRDLAVWSAATNGVLEGFPQTGGYFDCTVL